MYAQSLILLLLTGIPVGCIAVNTGSGTEDLPT